MPSKNQQNDKAPRGERTERRSDDEEAPERKLRRERRIRKYKGEYVEELKRQGKMRVNGPIIDNLMAEQWAAHERREEYLMQQEIKRIEALMNVKVFSGVDNGFLFEEFDQFKRLAKEIVNAPTFAEYLNSLGHGGKINVELRPTALDKPADEPESGPKIYSGWNDIAEAIGFSPSSGRRFRKEGKLKVFGNERGKNERVWCTQKEIDDFLASRRG